MNKMTLTHLLTGGLFALLCALPAAAANTAGTAVFVSGKSTATDPAGQLRTLKAGNEVYSGDLLETGKGRVQIKFLDGAFMSIQPNSRFQIEDYNYANQSDGSEKAVYNLFKGGMRAFTGAIGKKHPDAYKVKTPVATIGIRGTGHNTRVCAGDCTGTNGLPLPDGLYHSTWEGTTFVTNDLGTTSVPFGNAVYVKGINTPVQQSNEASQVTAVQPSGDTASDEQEEQVTLETGEQLGSNGAPEGVVPPPVVVIPPATATGTLNLVTIQPDLTDPPDNVDIGLLFQTTAFFGPGGPVGAFGTDVNDGPPGMGTLATINPDAILASTSPLAAGAKALINTALANPANDAVFAEFYASPAGIAEYTVASGIGFGRWANGKVLLFDDEGGVFLKMLSDDQALHYIFGNSPAIAAEGARGTYEFVGGTHSTTTSGNAINGTSIDTGATSGTLDFDFDNLSGTLVMTVSHGLVYTIAGDLLIDVVFPSLFASNGAMATTTSGNCSEGGCIAFVEGSFFGPLHEGSPAGAGLEYDIQDSGDVITGVAAFNNVTEPPPPEPTLVANQTLISIEPQLVPEFLSDRNAGEGIFFGSTVLVSSDSADNSGLVGNIGIELYDDGIDPEVLLTLLTIDPNGVLAVSSPDADIAKEFITDALDVAHDGGVDAAKVNAVISNPATIAESVPGSHLGSNYAYGRWSDGNVLIIDEDIYPDSPTFGDRTVDADLLENGLNLHWMFADASVTDFGLNATGTYSLLGGTASSHTNGGPVGSGVQSGSLLFDFTSLNGKLVNMVVLDNAITYTVNGDLWISFDRPGEFHDTGKVTALTSDDVCITGCNTLIDGSFFGAHAGTGVDGAPVLAGLDYEVVTSPFDGESGESVIGNAIFGRTGTADPIPSLTQIPNQTLIGIEPNLFVDVFDPDNADGGRVFATTVLLDKDNQGADILIGASGQEFNDQDSDIRNILLTNDPNGILAINSPNSAVAIAQGFIADALADEGDAAIVNAVIDNPATLDEFTQGSYLGSHYAYARWTDGNILFIDEDMTAEPIRYVESDLLGPGQNLHLLYGDSANTDFGLGATGTYSLLGGTASSNTNGDLTNGSLLLADAGGLVLMDDGVQSGSLLFDFTSLSGRLVDMVVLDDAITYTVNGGLQIDFDRPGEFHDDGSVTALTDDNVCIEGCNTLIDGSFFGAQAGTGADGAPVLAGLGYEIVTEPFNGEFGESIIGNAIFGRTGTTDPIPSVIPDQGLILVLSFGEPGFSYPVFAQIDSVTNIVGGDSLLTRGLLTTAGMQNDGEVGIFGVATIDPAGLLAIDSTDQNVLDAQDLVTAAMDDTLNPDNPAAVALVNSSPATVAEFFQGNGFAYGRWADGNILSVNEGDAAEVLNLAGGSFQSLHYITGDIPEMPAQFSGATGTYDFTGGTRSTSFSGDTIGDGVIDGMLTFDFDNPFGGTIDMTVRHGPDYTVAGDLVIDINRGGFYDNFVSAYNSDINDPCGGEGGCFTAIDGGFAGALSGGDFASPAHAGLEYEIYTSEVDGIMGVAAFDRTGDGPVTTELLQ